MTSCSRIFRANLQQHHLKIPNIFTAFFFVALRPDSGSWPYLTRLYDHCHLGAPHTVGLLWTSDQPDAETVLDSTRSSQVTDIRTTGQTRIHSPSKPATADPRLRQCGHWDRRSTASYWNKFCSVLFKIYLICIWLFCISLNVWPIYNRFFLAVCPQVLSTSISA